MSRDSEPLKAPLNAFAERIIRNGEQKMFVAGMINMDKTSVIDVMRGVIEAGVTPAKAKKMIDEAHEDYERMCRACNHP